MSLEILPLKEYEAKLARMASGLPVRHRTQTGLPAVPTAQAGDISNPETGSDTQKGEDTNEYRGVLVCGGAGFMGSNFVRYILNKYPEYRVINYDKLTYAGNLDNLQDIENDPRYKFIKADIADKEALEKVITEENINIIVNFAAETHVDRSIGNAEDFVKTNVHGVHTLLEAATKHNIRLVQISTDEVFGSTLKKSFHEDSHVRPNSPYSATKAAGDMLCRSYYKTYRTDVLVTHSCNVFGPFQYPEKLIPLFVTNLIDNKKIPVYGDGQNVREWIFVEDHSRAVDLVMHQGRPGNAYNIGTGHEKSNIDITKTVIKKLDKNESYIKFVEDRKGHDRRYAVDSTKLRQMGWSPVFDFDSAMDITIDWYRNNEAWWRKLSEPRPSTPTLQNENPLSYENKDKLSEVAAAIPRQTTNRMKALITAGGRGTRLRPITFTLNKHVIPIANKPMIEHAIEKVVRAGITDIGISINEGDRVLPQIVGDGSRFGAKITYIEQRGGALGLAHVVKNAREFLGDSDFLFYLGDNVILSDLNEFVNAFYEKRLNCFLALSHVKDPHRFGVPEIQGDRIVRVLEKPENPPSNFAVTGIYIYDKNIHKAIENLQPSSRGELEISDAHTALIEMGYNIGHKEITGWWKDTGKPADLLEGNRLLLDNIQQRIDGFVAEGIDVQGSVIVEKGAKVMGKGFIRGPVIIGENTKIMNAYIGPHTSIGSGALIEGVEIEHSIIMDRARIQAKKRIVDSIFGYNVRITASEDTFPKGNKMIVGDNSNVEI
ncbi:MAG: dTDP-glucose 4,6-dehydratase [Candidatus Spechtbacterales bacterium]